MAEAYYEPTPATDGATMNPVPGAVFQVFELADTAFTTPLSLRVGAGNPTTTVTASESLATLPGVYVTSPNFEHHWKSGDFVWRRDSIDGAKGAIQRAESSALSAANAAADSERESATSAQAAKDAAALVDAPADTVLADLAGNPSSAFATQLNATIADATEGFGPGATALQGFTADLANGIDDLSLVIVGDSTTVENTPSPSWARRLPAKLAAQYPHLTISTRILSTTSPYNTFDAATVINGTGTRTLHIWIFARAGETWQFFTDAVRRSVGFGATTNPNAIIINNGHNDNAAGVSTGTDATLRQVRDKAVAHIEQVKAWCPGVPVALIGQNPNTTFPNSSERRSTIYRRMATERGMEFINVTQAFYDDGRPMSELVRDGTHPSNAGYEIWVDKVMEHLVWRRGAQPVTILASSYNTLARNLLADPFFANWDGVTTPAGWTLSNVTLSKDTVNFETGTWGMKMTKTAGGSAAWVQIPLTHQFIAGQRGTFAARVRVPAGVTDNAAQVALLASGQALDGSAIWNTKDQFMWRIVHKPFPDGITSASARIYVDPSTAAGTPDITVDRISFALGLYPTEPV